MNVLLTSCGLETKAIEAVFMDMLPKQSENIRAIFVPTAAISPDAIEVLPKCLNDLLTCGIKRENITIYDLYESLGENELQMYEVIYLCGGNSEYLLKRINESGFDSGLKRFIKKGGVVVGVSAGRIVFANNLKNNLGLLKCALRVHCADDDREKAGNYIGYIKETVKLGNKQAMILCDGGFNIIE